MFPDNQQRHLYLSRYLVQAKYLLESTLEKGWIMLIFSHRCLSPQIQASTPTKCTHFHDQLHTHSRTLLFSSSLRHTIRFISQYPKAASLLTLLSLIISIIQGASCIAQHHDFVADNSNDTSMRHRGDGPCRYVVSSSPATHTEPRRNKDSFFLYYTEHMPDSCSRANVEFYLSNHHDRRIRKTVSLTSTANF